MRFGGQMQDMGDPMLLHHRQNGGFVAQVGFFKSVFAMLRDSLQIFQMAGVGQAIQVDQLADFRAVNDVMDQVRSDESGAACDQQVHVKV